MRAIVTAPVARDLMHEFGNAVRLPGATNGVLQAWDVIDAARIIAANDATLSVYTTRATVPNVLKPFLVLVLRSDSAVAQTNVDYKRLADCDVGDFFRVRANDGSISVKTKPAMVAGDRPVDWTQVHEWYGVPDALGGT